MVPSPARFLNKHSTLRSLRARYVREPDSPFGARSRATPLAFAQAELGSTRLSTRWRPYHAYG